MASEIEEMRVQICYARPDLQLLKDLTVARGATIEDAIRISGIVRDAGDIDMAACKVGIYGKVKSIDTHLRDGDRIEIYRHLLADPKDARRTRAQKRK